MVQAIGPWSIRFFFFLAAFAAVMAYAPAAYAATIYANSATGSDSTGDGTSGNPYKTFHKAYIEAASGDTLDLAGTFDWSAADETGDASGTGYALNKNLVIEGQGATETIIQASSTAYSADRGIFTVGSSATSLVFRDLTLRYGYTASGSMAANAIQNQYASLTLERVIVTENRSAGTYTSGSYGAVNFTAPSTRFLKVRDSLFSRNGNIDGYNNYAGALVMNSSNTNAANEITNTTFFENGGAYYGAVYSRADVRVTNSTFIRNRGSVSCADVCPYGTGAEAYIKNSIFVNRITGASNLVAAASGVFIDGGSNIIETSTGVTFTDGVNGNFVGAQPNLGIATTTAPSDNGGHMLTMPLLAGSIAINAGTTTDNGGISVPSEDARGYSRSGIADIGAHEYGGIDGSDVTAPQISSVAASADATTATITWTTDEPADSLVEYGATASYGTASSSAALVTSHSITLTGLSPSTTYHYRVVSADAADNDSASGDATFATGIEVAEPVAYWKFDEGAGTSAADETGNGNTGTITGATYSTNVPEVEFDNPYSLEFDGVDDGVSTPLSVDGFSQFTIAGWAYPRSAEASEGWFGANDAFEFLFDDATTLRCWTGPGAVNWSFADDPDFLNAWHHITCLGDGESVRLYVDGDEVASTTHAFTNNYGSGDNFSIGLGVQNGGSSGPFDGFIDDVRVYDVALTPEEMFSLGTGSEAPMNNPIVTALSPSDGAADVAVDANLSITFSKTVGWESGNILIRDASDDSIVETIPAGGGPVSGSGTATLTINPQYDFEYDREYYVEIPDTAVRDTADQLFFAGLSGPSSWNFSTEEDAVAPVLTEVTPIPSLVPSGTDAIYYFETSERCNVQAYPPTASVGTVTLLVDPTDQPGQTVGAWLDGMQAGGTYSFSFLCEDAAGNGSNTLSVGPFTLESAPEEAPARSRRSGSSVQSRVAALEANGNVVRAAELRAEYSRIFGSNANVIATLLAQVEALRAQLAIIQEPAQVRDLELAMEGEDVRLLQRILIAADYSVPAGATGYFGAQTVAALAAYQAAHGIAPAAGYFGAMTRAQMTAAGMAGIWW